MLNPAKYNYLGSALFRWLSEHLEDGYSEEATIRSAHLDMRCTLQEIKLVLPEVKDFLKEWENLNKMEGYK